MQRIAAGAARMLLWISVISVVFIAAVTLIDVIGRYFNAPLRGAFEMIQLAMVFLIFSALPGVTLSREHVTVDLVEANLPYAVRRLTAILAGLFGMAVCIFYGMQLWSRGQYLERSGEVTSNLAVPVFPFAFFSAAMWIVTAACFAVLLAGDIKRFFTGTDQA